MRVVITGATGNVGTSLVEALAADPAITSIVGLSRRPVDRPVPAVDLRDGREPEPWQPARTELRVADVSRDRLDEHLDGADVVVHLAWLFHPTRDGNASWRNNVGGAERVFAAAARTGVQAIVYASSVGAYSPGEGDRRVDESWPTDSLPTAGYGREKAYVERLLDIFERDHPDRRVVRMRPAFLFKHEAAVGQRRIFAGPFVPPLPVVRRPGERLMERSRIPVIPSIPGLRFQVLHTADAAEAFRAAITRDVRGAFNVGSEPVVDLQVIADVLGASTVSLPQRVARQALAALYHLHLVPASPELFDLVAALPLMDTTRARTELGWAPRFDAGDTLRELLTGLHDETGFGTPPLSPATSGPFRVREILSGVGARPDA
jgi:UDP-glucose 4-epimerase